MSNSSWYNRRVPTLLGVLLALLALVVILLVVLGPKGHATPIPSPSGGASDSFGGNGATVVPPAVVSLYDTTTGVPFDGQATETVTRSTSCPIEWSTVPPLDTGHGWGVHSNAGWYYAFGAKVMWCTNAAGTKVTSLPEYRCFNLAGFWNYDWCHSGAKNRSSLGLYQVDLWPSFEYYLPKSGLYRHPHIDITIAANGHFWGTAYSDFSVICGYPGCT
jgi:hypothetical protein